VTSAWGLLLAAVLVLGNGFFVAVEFALLAARQTALTGQAETSARARRALYASRRLPLMIAGCQFGITLCSLGLGAVGEPAVSHVLEPGLEVVGLPDGGVHAVGFVLALMLVSALHMLLGEMVPKNLALAAPERSAVLLAPVLLGFIAGFRPLIAGLTAGAVAILRLMGVRPVDESMAAYTPDQIGQLVDEARSEGLLARHEHRQVTGALRFDQATVGSVMVARVDVVSVPRGVTPEQVEDAVARTGFSRFPVEDGGSWTGYVHLADALAVTGARQAKPLPATRIRALPSMSVLEHLPSALKVLQETGAHLAEVRDEQGTVGVVMLEDVLEQLVGEVQDQAALQR
jgi:CBS domain containing-hemolysin-like protein